VSERGELLRRVPLFAGLAQRELREIDAALTHRTYAAGDRIVAEGEPGIGFFVIEDGEAVVTVHGEERARLGRGDTFGDVALIAEDRRTATVTAETPLRCLAMTAWEFRPLVERDPTIAWHLLQSFARLLLAAEQRAQRH
jgi:CRP-like cAMP-binding protein